MRLLDWWCQSKSRRSAYPQRWYGPGRTPGPAETIRFSFVGLNDGQYALTRAVNAQSYELLLLPSGDLPVVGTITVENNQCVLTTYDKKRYWIRGDFASVFMDFEGAKVWAAGSVGEYALPEQPANSVPFKVIQYGVLIPR